MLANYASIDLTSSLLSYSYSDRHPGAFNPSRSQSHARSVPIRHLEPCMASISRRAKNNYPKQENERAREKIVLSWPKKAIRLPNVSHVFYHRSRHHSSQPDIASSSPLKGGTQEKSLTFSPSFFVRHQTSSFALRENTFMARLRITFATICRENDAILLQL